MLDHIDNNKYVNDWANRMIVLGRVSGVFGIQGWIKISSATEPRNGILQYYPWYIQHHGNIRSYRPLVGRIHGKGGLVAHLEGCDDRDQAMALVGGEIAVHQGQLPALDPGDFYWTDLEGLEVKTKDGLT